MCWWYHLVLVVPSCVGTILCWLCGVSRLPSDTGILLVTQCQMGVVYTRVDDRIRSSGPGSKGEPSTHSVPLYTLHRCEEPLGVVAEEVPPTGSGGGMGEAATAVAEPLAGVAHKTGGEHDDGEGEYDGVIIDVY